eukprot:13176433-Alexandrium_andersonii.AAC.1
MRSNAGHTKLAACMWPHQHAPEETCHHARPRHMTWHTPSLPRGPQIADPEPAQWYRHGKLTAEHGRII